MIDSNTLICRKIAIATIMSEVDRAYARERKYRWINLSIIAIILFIAFIII